MSRHTLRNDNDYTVVVGYDDPLDTYFAQVYDLGQMRHDAGGENGRCSMCGEVASTAAVCPYADEVLVVWTGEARPQEITEAALVLAQVGKYLPDGTPTAEQIELLRATLEDERSHRREPTEFQRATFQSLVGEDLP